MVWYLLYLLAMIRFCVFILNNNTNFYFVLFIFKIRRKMNRFKRGGIEYK